MEVSMAHAKRPANGRAGGKKPRTKFHEYTAANDMKYKGVFSAQEARLHWLTLYHRSARSLEVKIDPAARDSVSEVWLYAIPLQSPYTTGSRISFQLKKKK
jgi:hypothetical protein